MFRSILLTLAMTTATAAAAKDADEVQNTIAAQLAAFEAETLAEAFAIASPTIQQMFGTPEVFGRMVQRDYPMIYDPARVVYLERHDMGTAIYQEILFTDQSGVSHSFLYELILIDGAWRINGVYRHPSTGFEA